MRYKWKWTIMTERNAQLKLQNSLNNQNQCHLDFVLPIQSNYYKPAFENSFKKHIY